MRKLSKMAALGLALALTFGMTVSAEESVKTSGVVEAMQEEQRQEYTDKANESYEVVGTVTTTITSSTGATISVPITAVPVAAETMHEVEQITKSHLDVFDVPGKNVTSAKIVGSANIVFEGTVPAEGINLTIPITGIEAGKNYVLLHLTSAGWETIMPSEVKNGFVTANFKSLSPVIANEVTLVEVEEEKDGSDDSGQAAPTAPTNPATSPKTAETLPVAGVMALICLAGAAVCANKVRYNK